MSPAGTREFFGGMEGRNPFAAATLGVEKTGGIIGIFPARVLIS